MSIKLRNRYLVDWILKDLKKKMVFVGGPRQVGKTTLAQSLLKDFHDNHPAYLNWDLADHRARIRNKEWPKEEKLIVFDEIHKLRGWRNLVKGYYDLLKNTHSFLITGSAKLDHFRRGGDSLLGRYHYYRLHPYSIAEVGHVPKNLHHLFTFGGFPEPFHAQDERELKRWHRNRLSMLVRFDLREISNVIEIDKIELLAEELPRRVGSPLSVRNLALDLEIDPKTAKAWIGELDALYYCFQLSPFGTTKMRAVKKEQKLYLWDWSQIEDPGIRFENMVASHLLKFCHYHEDVNGEKMELRYIRDVLKREVDFVVIKNKKPLFAVEAKLKPQGPSDSITYCSTRLNIPHFYQVHLEGPERQVSDKITICDFITLSKRLNLI
jgi:uncharacterized protein